MVPAGVAALERHIYGLVSVLKHFNKDGTCAKLQKMFNEEISKGIAEIRKRTDRSNRLFFRI